MTNLGIGFKVFSGDLLEKILVKSTDTKIKSILFGTLSTLIMQFSILVSIVTISFLSAGLISLGAGIGIIFGANLGNTASSWLIVGLTNIKISMLAIPLLIIGVLFFFQKDSVSKEVMTLELMRSLWVASFLKPHILCMAILLSVICPA